MMRPESLIARFTVFNTVSLQWALCAQGDNFAVVSAFVCRNNHCIDNFDQYICSPYLYRVGVHSQYHGNVPKYGCFEGIFGNIDNTWTLVHFHFKV